MNLDSKGATNGLQAVECVKESLNCCPFKIIFMDCSMPIMDGYEATRRIVKLFDYVMNQNLDGNTSLYSGDEDLRKIPVVALTANDTNEERKKCIESGMMAFFTKPPCYEELKKFIAEIFPELKSE